MNVLHDRGLMPVWPCGRTDKTCAKEHDTHRWAVTRQSAPGTLSSVKRRAWEQGLHSGTGILDVKLDLFIRGSRFPSVVRAHWRS
jgi:hypothetical protein